MYVEPNFKSKKALKKAIAEGQRVTVFSPGVGSPPHNGRTSVEGPHFPEPHRWYGQVTITDGRVTAVK